MTEIRFYHLERQPMEKILPILVSKAYKNGHKILIKTETNQSVEKINALLWTFTQNSFIPHASEKDGHKPELQPIWITEKNENDNNADLIILVDKAESDLIDEFKLCCKIFNGNLDDVLQDARRSWKEYKDAGHETTYWQQGEKGWEQKA